MSKILVRDPANVKLEIIFTYRVLSLINVMELEGRLRIINSSQRSLTELISASAQQHHDVNQW